MRLEGILPFERASAQPADDVDLVSDFEQWCELVGIHPEAFGAWEAYERSFVAAG